MNQTPRESDAGLPLNPDTAALLTPTVPPRDVASSSQMPFASLLSDDGGPLTVSDAIARYLALRLIEGLANDGDTYRHLDKQLAGRLCAFMGDAPLRSVKADHLRTWAAGLVNERTGRPLDPVTRRHHLVAVKTFFKRAWREGWIDRDPTLPIVLPAVEEKDVAVMPVADVFRFFSVNRNHRAVGRVALEAFGGLRYTSAARLVKADIKFERRGIEMPSTKHKSRKRKFRQGQPANLWAWLAHAPDDCWKLSVYQYREEKKEMLVMAGLRSLVLKSEDDRVAARRLKNVWRHSFASYLLAKAKDYAPIAYLMQHARATTTEVYEGMADEGDATRYFSITPTTVLMSWDAFCSAIPLTHHEPHPNHLSS